MFAAVIETVIMADDAFEILDLFDDDSFDTKYKRIVNSVIQAVRRKRLRRGERLPSVRGMCERYSISRDTVCKAYEILREKGVIEKFHGKGYVVANDSYKADINVFVMFDIWNPYKEKIYTGLLDSINAQTEGQAAVQVYYSNRDEDLFAEFLTNSAGKFEYYVVMPFESEKVRQVIRDFDQSKLLVADVYTEYAGEGAVVIAQSHDEELTRVLLEAQELIKRYNRFILCFPVGYFIPECLKRGYERFCAACGIEPEYINNLCAEDVVAGNAYFVIEDPDLVTLVKASRNQGYKLGRDVGLLSYNSTPLKEVIEGGLTTVSIDFYRMGELIAEQIVNRDIAYQLVPTELILGNTL